MNPELADAPTLIDLVDLADEMGDTVGIIEHLARSRTLDTITVNQWCKLASSLDDGLRKIRETAAALVDENKATAEAHRAALAAVEAKKAAPGSREDFERAQTMWTMLVALTEVAARRCVDAGFPPFPPLLEGAMAHRRAKTVARRRKS
jgi:hypothetical protein